MNICVLAKKVLQGNNLRICSESSVSVQPVVYKKAYVVNAKIQDCVLRWLSFVGQECTANRTVFGQGL